MSLSTLCAFPLLLSVVLNGALYARGAMLLRRRPACDPEEPIPWLPRALAFLAECAASLACVFLAPLAWRRAGTSPAGARPGIVLVPGLPPTAGASWLLARRLRGRGYAVLLSSGPRTSADIPAAAERLRRDLASLQEAGPAPLAIVAAGAGGLVARYCLRRHAVAGVKRVLTIGTPHLGTSLAPQLGACGSSLHPGSALIARLNAADRLPEQFDFVSIYSRFDACIVPPTNGHYPRAFNVEVRLAGHTTLLFSPRVLDLVVENLRA